MEVARVKLKWNNHQCVFSHYLQDFINQPRYSDAMIACESRIFMVHRIILSTCSYFFEEIFQHAPNDNTRPVIILNDTAVESVEWLLSYMYCGEVTVPKDALPVLFKLAEQLKVKGLSHLQVPETNTRQVLTDTNENNPDNPAHPRKRQKSQKRKASPISNNLQTKKPMATIPLSPHPDGTSFVLTLPQNTPPLNMGNPGSGPLTPSSIMISPPAPGSMANSACTTILPGGIMLPEALPNSAMSVVTLPFSSVPSSLPSSEAPTTTAGFTKTASMPILANCLLGKSQDRLVGTPLTAKQNGVANSVEGASYNFMPAGNTYENSLLVDIKEEVKEEPLTLGPDDPMATDDEDEDFIGWNDDPTAPNPENTVEKSLPAEFPVSALPVPTAVGPTGVTVCKLQKGTLGKTPVVETAKEPAVGTPGRTSHVLPQILQKPAFGTVPVLKVKENKKLQQTHEPSKTEEQQQQLSQPPLPQQNLQQQQQQQQPELVKIQMFSGAKKEDRRIYPSPQKKNIEMNDLAPTSEIQSKIVNHDEPADPNEISPKNSPKEHSQPGPSPIGVTVPPVKGLSDSQSQLEDDVGLQEMMEFIQEEEADNPTFVPIDSDKKRNQPYLIRSSKIATKNLEPVKFCLRGAKANQGISICMRYTEEKYKHIPVYACRLHQRDNEKCNFQVSAPGEVLVSYKEEEGHPVAHLAVSQHELDNMSSFTFYVTFVCLNSCHKENGKKMELIFKLTDLSTNQVLKEKHFVIRVCKNVKRDYKEAIQAEQNECLKVLVRPDSFLYPDEMVLSESRSAGKGLSPVNEPVAPENNVPVSEGIAVPSNQTTITESTNHEFYLVRLPNSKRGKMVLDLVREFEKTILDLEPGSSQNASESSSGANQ